jgi:alginate O-acetyltransferase complex protein AlgI
MGGNRHGKARRYLNMGITMVLGGLWHGAGWTFIIWGALHGTYLAINHAWRSATEGAPFRSTRWYEVLCWCTTFLAVLFAWVFFRAQTLTGALNMLAAMFGMGGDATARLPLAHGTDASLLLVFACLLPLVGIVVWAPNSQQITARLLVQPEHFDSSRALINTEPFEWRAVPLNRALALGAMLAAALACMSQPTEFLYFNF